MCFSAEASLGASIVITTIGVVTYKKAERTPFRWLAIIPILFGLQQFFEGIVWLSITRDSFSNWLHTSTYGYLIFAWIIWPIYIPFTLWILEKNELRKKLLFTLLILGAISASALFMVMLNTTILAEIQDCSIYYNFDAKHALSWLLGVFYLSATVLAHFFSSIRNIWILGVLNIITYLYTRIYYHEQTISVWCFLAAITSILILWIVKTNQSKSIPT